MLLTVNTCTVHKSLKQILWALGLRFGAVRLLKCFVLKLKRWKIKLLSPQFIRGHLLVQKAEPDIIQKHVITGWWPKAMTSWPLILPGRSQIYVPPHSCVLHLLKFFAFTLTLLVYSSSDGPSQCTQHISESYMRGGVHFKNTSYTLDCLNTAITFPALAVLSAQSQYAYSQTL